MPSGHRHPFFLSIPIGWIEKKGGGGLMAYFSSKMVSHRVKLPKQYKLLEILAINATINNNDVLFVGIYRAPNATGTDYYRKLEEEFNSLCMWATMECNTLILTGDLNLDRLRPERTEGKNFAQSRGGLWPGVSNQGPELRLHLKHFWM